MPSSFIAARHLSVPSSLKGGAIAIGNFDADFARLDPETFVKTVLVDELAIRHVAVGWNFHFGAGRHGTTARLAELGAKYGFTVEILPPFETEDGFTVSSSAVRDRLAEGNLAEATGLMGWCPPYALLGYVGGAVVYVLQYALTH